MFIARYFDLEHKDDLNQIDNSYPFVFQKEYATFLKENLNSDLVFIVSHSQKIFIPIRLYKIRFFSFAQILYPPLKEAKRLDEEQEQGFLNTLVQFVKEKKLCHRIVEPPPYAIFQAVPDKAVYCNFGTYFLDLENYSEEELFLHLEDRAAVRHAKNNGIVIEYGRRQLPIFYELYKQTMKRADMFYSPFSYFESFYDYLTEAKVICAVAYHQNLPQGTLLMPYTGYAAYYLYGASAENITIRGAVDFLHWQVIKLMKARGVKRYDFSGARLSDVSKTKLSGIQHFKAKFGGQLGKGYLWKIDINRIYASSFDILLRCKAMFKREKPNQDFINQELKR